METGFAQMKRIGLVIMFAVLLSGCSVIKKAVSGKEPQSAAAQAASPSQNTAASSGKQITAGEKPSVSVGSLFSSPARRADKAKTKPVEETTSPLADSIIALAKTKLGNRYLSGGKGPVRFDCSGFTGFVFKQFGITLGASSRDQALQGSPVKKGDLRPGDLVFFNGHRISSSTVGHVGIVVTCDNEKGTFTFIHAAVSTGIEIMTSTAPYYAARYLFARRVLPEN